MLYWVPCFLCLVARTKKHRSSTPKENRKKIGENSSIEAFFAVQVSHNPERVLKITHANNQKKSAKKNLGLPPKTGYNRSSETTPTPKKNRRQFFSKKCYVKPIISISLLLFWRYHNKMLYWVPCFLCLGARTKKRRSLTPKKNRKKYWRKFFNRGFFRRSSQPQSWKSAQNNARKQPKKKIGQKKIWGCLRRQVTTCLRRQPHPPPPPKKK